MGEAPFEMGFPLMSGSNNFYCHAQNKCLQRSPELTLQCVAFCLKLPSGFPCVVFCQLCVDAICQRCNTSRTSSDAASGMKPLPA